MQDFVLTGYLAAEVLEARTLLCKHSSWPMKMAVM